MSDPVLVEVTRGRVVESRHRGAVAVCDADGSVVFALGDLDVPVFPRSAVKAIQALPLIESGAADAFGFGMRELALAQASHSGEAVHVATATRMLAAAGLDEADLECGVHPPMNPAAAAELIRSGQAPSQLHNNCSGKHSGFLAVARHLGVDPRGYVEVRHPVQQAVHEALESVTGAAHDHAHCGTDGCSIPTYAVPLDALARGFACIGSGQGLSAGRAAAARHLFEAAVAEPYLVAGEARFDTDVMRLLGHEAQIKAGAEGCHCAALPRLGFGIAVECDDGGGRGAEALMAAVLARLFPQHAEALRRWTNAPIPTRRGVPVGEVRAVAEAFSALS